MFGEVVLFLTWLFFVGIAVKRSGESSQRAKYLGSAIILLFTLFGIIIFFSAHIDHPKPRLSKEYVHFFRQNKICKDIILVFTESPIGIPALHLKSCKDGTRPNWTSEYFKYGGKIEKIAERIEYGN